ncbi:hypothetical protein [uncultured Winogradskyella sp.]|uniref:hypothetical protein n=1 Tax=Winogradskyella sp. 4-2091 TaxID=3381659 RepID=UPI0026106E40|nr:hypothetical protein [uncultured Winogradskyella sp.]
MKNIYYVLSSLLLFIIGFFCYQSFFVIVINIVGLHDVELVSNSISSRFVTRLVFAIILSCIPALYYNIQKMFKISFWFDGAYILVIMAFFGSLFSILRGVYIYEKLMVLTSIKTQDRYKLSYALDDFNFEYYLLFGFIVGGLISSGLLSLRPRLKDEN